jgi:tripartite-type tricarboxylate transporter receptor subunit TctC
MTRRLLGRGLLAASLCIAVPAAPALAQDTAWPSRPVRIVVPFPPGGAADTFARLIAEHAGKSIGQPVVAENRPGAGGQIATELVAKAPADGHTFLIVTVGHAVNPSLYPKLPYDTLGDLVPVARIADLPSVLVVNPEVPAKTVGELLTSQAGVKAVHVAYKGSAPAVTDLIGGQVQWMIDPILSSAQHVKAGRLRALAVSTAKRSSLVPELPTLAESGVPGYDFSAWFVLLAPAKTPPAIVERMSREVERILAQPDVKARFAALGAEPGSGGTAQTAAFLAAEVKRYAAVVRDANMKVD